MTASATLQASKKKRDERERAVKEMEDKLGVLADHPEDADYTHTRPLDIVANLKSRKAGWTVERIMIAFIRTACDAHRKTNCLTEVMFHEALEAAKLKDKELDVSPDNIQGDFWGLPSSFKDTYNIIGVDTSLGLSQFCDQPTAETNDEAGLVKVFRKAGGIPFCKTNVPQTLFATECSNPIFGTSTNPHDSLRTPGGSSGGEAALVALHGTPIGWGSDVGGSLRVPSHNVGICALKPVRGRWPHSGGRPTVPGSDGVKVVEGPMARTVDDLIFASRTVLSLIPKMEGSFKGESLIPLPWRETEQPKRLKIGYFTGFPGLKTSPACSRAVRDTVEKLQAAGHEAVSFEPPRLLDAFKSFASMTSSDGYGTLLGNLGPDPMEPSLRLVTLGSKMPWLVHQLAVQILRWVVRDTLFADIFAVSRPKSVKELWAATALRDECNAEFCRAAWDHEAFDAVICPVLSVPAMEHGRTTLLSPVAIGTIVFNIIDSTVGVLPVARVDRELDSTPPDFLKGSVGSWILERRMYEGTNPAYNADKMHGLPIGVQVVAKPWQEEKVLKIMKVVEEAVKFK
ncbi:putative Acetamidase [Kockovaella imperatae]|uniref:amidase n=1 Tax=Kockovaella imperatae TaxID=4999 RepID=A0A1Y1UHB0_9TREE|nr:putative Acetamidase [Kockovaella imperatae]ORX37379.1 putative Acetamidase [Kockovaella imperatae]